MLDKLYYFQSILGTLLHSGTEWNTLDINYEKPHVRRVWRQVGDYRINLHEILPCDPTVAFFHPHRVPSAMKIEKGRYGMNVGYGARLVEPSKMMNLILPEGAYYEMTDSDSWHSVYPIDEPVMSLMITGKPWPRLMPKSDKIQLSCLSDDVRDGIIEFFQRRYPNVK